MTRWFHCAKTKLVKKLKEGKHNMRNKLEEINLAMVAVKFGEEYANRIADLFTDEDIITTKKLIKSKKCKEAIYKRWGKKQKPKLTPIEISNRKHLMDMFKQLAALKKEVEVLDETINSSIQAIIDIYLNTEKETKR